MKGDRDDPREELPATRSERPLGTSPNSVADRPSCGDYELICPIGGGGMAETWEARRRGQARRFFLKRVKTASVELLALNRERQIYEKLSRAPIEGFLQVEDSFDADGYSVLVTEFADGGDLDAFVAAHGALPHDEALKLAVRVCGALSELHSRKIVHRDVKAKNIVLVGAAWNLADFGIAKNLGRLITKHTFQGAHSDWYAPPEQVRGVEAAPSADVFAFGRLLTFMLAGKSHGKVDDLSGISFARQWRALIEECTEEDPLFRPTSTGVLTRLESNF